MVFDRADLLERLEGDEELFVEILTLFVEDGAIQLERIDQAIASGDASVVEHAAHALKGAASNVSASALAAVAASLELTARKGELAEAPALATRIAEEFARFKAAIAMSPTRTA